MEWEMKEWDRGQRVAEWKNTLYLLSLLLLIIIIILIITFGWSYMLCPAKDLYTYFHSYVMFLETFFYLLHIFVNELVYHYITLLINQRNSNFWNISKNY